MRPSIYLVLLKPGTRVEVNKIKAYKKPMNIDVKLKQRNWCIMVDERPGLKYSIFHEKKSDMVDHICRQLHSWKQDGRPVKFIGCDDAGENKNI